jgi:subtilase family serine protease
MKSITRPRSHSSRKKKIYTCALGFALVMGVALPALAVAAGLVDASAQSASVEHVGSITAPQDLGRVASDQEQAISVHLKLHDQAGFDQAVSALYDPATPTFHHWFTDADFAKYAPTAAELQTVRAELERQGLKTISVDPLNFSIRVRGKTTAIESAFHTELHSYSYGTSVVQTPTSEPKLAGPAGDLVAATVGVERHQAHPQYVTAKDPLTGKPQAQWPISPAQPASYSLSHYTTTTALAAPGTLTLKGHLPLPYASYSGPIYGDGWFQFVSYQPSQLQGFYGMTPLINQGYDGRGQTIALVEAFGYANAEADANAAASLFGLPPLNSSTFKVIYPSGQPQNPNDADYIGWTTEIALDVQAAHAIAPGAQIVEVASAGQDDEDFVAALEYILTHHVANIVSCSWEVDPEIVSGPAEEQAFNPVLQRMAAAGISVQFSSGDSGDFGLGTPLGAVSVPSNSPYVTAVGGTSVMNDPLGSGDVVTGWGTYRTLLGTNGAVASPPDFLVGKPNGSGGGESQYYSKPSWQSSLPGKGRQVPDVSALADPFTGFSLIVTSFGVQYAVASVGGTSLASPLFSAVWAIAQQYNHETLGQAAPTVARLKPGQITDVVGTSDLTPHNASGTITDSNGATFYSTADLFADAGFAQKNYLAAISQLPGTGVGNTFAITFGTDTSLTVGPGWDNVTGYGQPNGLPFIQAVGSKNH